MKYNIWNKWDPIEVVMLGDAYKPEFFDIKDKPKAMDALKIISEETLQELDYFESVLKDFGAEVLRPRMDNNQRLSDFIGDNLGVIPRSSLQPRDSQLVLGNQLYYTGDDHPSIQQTLNNYCPDFDYFTDLKFDISAIQDPEPIGLLSENIYNIFKGQDWPSFEKYREKNFQNVSIDIRYELLELEVKHNIAAPNITVVGSDIYVDDPIANMEEEYEVKRQEIRQASHISDLFYQQVGERYTNFRVNRVTVGGHNDASFHTIKPGAILSLADIQTYENTFPGWDICYLPYQSWGMVSDFMKVKSKTRGKWWVPGQEANDEFTNFVEDWLGNWVGYVEETVFDVNVFVLDEHHVCVNNMNEQVVNFCKKHKMECVHIPWRHRYFWDGGLHCITLDLKRRGVQKDYFPERTEPVTDGGF